MDGREKKKVSFLLPREVYNVLREQALESRRSTAGYMCLILKRYAAYRDGLGEGKDSWLKVD